MTLPLWARTLLILSVTSLVLAACNTGYGRSSNARLASLTVSAGTLSPNFDADETSYTVTVGVETISFNASTASTDASMRLNDSGLESNVDSVEQALVLGENTFTIRVTAENENTKNYSIVVTREPPSSDASLSALTVGGGELDPAFDSATTSYSVAVSYLVNATRITTVRSNGQARVTSAEFANETLADNEASDAVALAVGDTNITLNVEAGDGTTEDYSLTFTRAPQDELATSVYIKASNPDVADLFGSAIAFERDTLVVGAPEEDSHSASSEGSDSATGSGAVYVFENSGGVWSQTQYIKASPSVVEDEKFGASLALDGETLVVGATGTNSGTGSVYILEFDGVDEWAHEEIVQASDRVTGDLFGSVVDVYGDYIAVGAPAKSTNGGAVYIFERDGSSWEQMQVISTTVTSGRFGEALAFNRESENPELIIGAPGENTSTGAVYIYELNGSEWTTNGSDRLQAENPDTNDLFGTSVAIKDNLLVVGASGEASNANDVDGDETNDLLSNSGAAYVFERSSQGSNWGQEFYFKASRDSDMQFGSSVAMSANMIAVGAPFEDSDATDVDGDDNDTSSSDSGAVYVFEKVGDDWQSQIYVKSSNTGGFDQFGQQLAFSGSNLIVAAPNEDGDGEGIEPVDNNAGADAGAVYIVD
ncbi:MAG: cadherin-like beta sandwich domain-containing protein [Agarilytica sp.]